MNMQMPTRMQIFAICAATLIPVSLYAQEERANRATAKLVKELTQAEPGRTMWLGVQFKMDDGWHLYWPGRNDTGIAPEFKVTLPDGWTLGKARWSAPQRHVSAGNIVDYTYDKEMMVLFPLEVPANVAVGEIAEVSMDASWLVCNDTCIPEKQALKTQIRVGVVGGSKPVATQVDSFAKARAAQPRPISEATGNLITSIKDGALLITAPGCTRIEFMPSIESVPLANASAEGAIDADTLSADLGEPDAGSHGVSGIVALYRGGKRETYWLDLSVHDDVRLKDAPEAKPAEADEK
ncbi:MAG: protein-disulfide reductase DsbD domain-containing protein [Phycisphaerales bacterium]